MNLVTNMTEHASNPVLLSFKGIEGLGRKSLAFLFSSQKTICYKIVEEHPEAIEIIDVDHRLGKSAWKHSQSGNREQPVVIVGCETMDVKNGIFLQKPFLPRQLLAAVESLVTAVPNTVYPTGDNTPVKEKTQTPSQAKKALLPNPSFDTDKPERFTHIGTTPDVDLDDAEAVAQVLYDPGQFLAQRMLELIELAAKEKKYIRANCCSVVFYVDPHQGCIRTLVKERNLRTFGALPLDHGCFLYQKEAKLPADIESRGFSYAYEPFIWRMILAGSRGRLPENTDLDQRFLLGHWPNLDKLLPFPHLTQISTAWTTGPKSIREMAGTLEIPQRYLFVFFTAASMMGYLHPVNADGSPATPSSNTENNSLNKGLFQRLLKRRSE
ncbi:hypothetical protein [Thiolapillus sp.]